MTSPSSKYRVELTTHAERILRQFAARERALYERLLRVLDDLADDPFQGKALRGELKGRYSYRVGSYRILYRLAQHRLVVIIIDIGHRRDIYR